MTVIVLTAVPSGLRGHLTRWLMEVAPGVYVGRVSSRVRDELWSIVGEMLGTGRAIMIFSARNEQGLEIRNYGHSWTPVDIEGITLMRRPPAFDATTGSVKARAPKALRYRRARPPK